MKHVFTFFFLLVSFAIAFAQPGQRAFNGCHHSHNKSRRQVPLTERELQVMNESIARSDTFDILNYTIHLDVSNYASYSIAAATTIQFAARMNDLNSISFDLYNLIVDSVKWETNDAVHAYDGNILTIQSPVVLNEADTSAVTVYYHGQPYQDPVWGGFYFQASYIYNLGIGLSSIPPNFGRVWYPCFDSFVERATYEYHVKTSGALRAHCQGTFLGETVVAADTVIRSFAMNQPIPTHLSAIAVAAYQDVDYVHAGVFGDVPVRLTAKSANIGAMQNVMVNVGAAIDALQYWYGPYIWERVGYVLTTDGALEIPTNIAYPQFMVGESVISNNNLLSHELGHLWWGDVVTPHIHNDMWLKEGPAEYSSHLLTEWLYGEEDFVDQVKTNHLDVLRNAHIDDEGFHPLSPMPDPVIYGTHTYYKGASVMHNLRGYLGDELFRVAMTEVQADHVFQDVTPEQFRDYLEDASDVELDDFFADQVFQPGFSVFVVDSFSSQPEGNHFLVNIHVQQKLRECPQFYHHVPLDLTFISADNQREEIQIDANGQFTDIQLPCNFDPAMVVLNGYNRLNQARMDHEFMVYSDESLYPVLPYVDFRFSKENVVDSSLVRIEHIWASPDQNAIGNGIFELSNTHYYLVDGLWDDGDFYSGRVNYNGSQETDLDYALYSSGEQQAVLVYRENSSQPWEVYSDFTLGTGSLTNGDGNFVIDTLRRGQYAFANGDITAGLQLQPESSISTLDCFPNPATTELQVSGNFEGNEVALFDVYAANGRFVQRSSARINGAFTKRIDTSALGSGTYFVQVSLADGRVLGVERVIVE
ncbi:MAG: M1 family aminopeptidase [Flavobacteriales bacterium]